jgi:hypothetical protein
MHPNDAETITRDAITYRLLQEQERGAFAPLPYPVQSLQSLISMPGQSTRSTTCGIVHFPSFPQWKSRLGARKLIRQRSILPKEREDLFSKRIVKIRKSIAQFAEAMKFLLVSPAMQHKFAIEGYEWEKHAKGTVVDVGGGHGAIAFRLADKYPEMKIIVQD